MSVAEAEVRVGLRVTQGIVVPLNLLKPQTVREVKALGMGLVTKML